MSELNGLSDLNRRDGEMDALLRRSMAAPVPALPGDFERRVMRRVVEGQQGSRSLDRYRRVLLAGYGLASLLTSALIMHGQGLNWAPVAGSIVVSAAVAAGVARLRRSAIFRSGKVAA
jgi:hypothetical protein